MGYCSIRGGYRRLSRCNVAFEAWAGYRMTRTGRPLGGTERTIAMAVLRWSTAAPSGGAVKSGRRPKKVSLCLTRMLEPANRNLDLRRSR